MLYETRRFMFTVSLCAMLAVNPVLATAPSEEEPLGTGHDVYVESTNSGADGAPLNLAGGIAGVTYVNRMVNTAGNAAQAAENHAAAAGAAAVSAGTAADAAQKSADAAQESADAAQESADAAQQVLTTKLDKGQGTENANRVMIVGADGNLTPGMVGMANIGAGAVTAPAIADGSIHGGHLVGYSDGTSTSGLVSVDGMGNFRFGRPTKDDLASPSGVGRILGVTPGGDVVWRGVEASDILIGSGHSYDIAASGTVMISDGVSGVRWGKLPASSISNYAPGTGFMRFGTPMISDGYSGATWGMILPNSIDPYGAKDGMALTRWGGRSQWGQVDVSGIADNAVTTEKINDSAITTDKINDAAVTADKIADKTITADKIVIKEAGSSYTGMYLGANGNDGDVDWQYITLESLHVIHDPGIDYGRVPVLGRKDGYANAVLSLGQVGSAGIADGAVTALHISSAGVTPGLSLVAGADGVVGWKQIGSVGIANGAITTDKIADKNVTPAKIADNAITTAKIANTNVTTAKIADKAVTAEKLADGVFTTDKIADSAVITEKLADNAVVTVKIADNAITTAKIADKAVTAEKLADGILSAKVDIAQGEANANKAMVIDAVGNVFAGQVVADAIADNAVVTAKIADNAVTTEKINDSAITTAKIADKNVTTDKIADKAVTAEKLADGILSAKVDIAQGEANANKAMVIDAVGNVFAGQVVADAIADNAVVTAKIADKAVTAEKLADGVLSAKVDIAQGEANANKAMVTDASGNVVTTDVLSPDVLPVATHNVAGAVKKLPSYEEAVALMESGALSEEDALAAVPSSQFMVEFVDESTSSVYDSVNSKLENKMDKPYSSTVFGAVPMHTAGGSVTWRQLDSSGIADRAVSVDKMSSRYLVNSWDTYTGIVYTYGNATFGSTLVANGRGDVYWGQLTSSGIADREITTAKIADKAVTTAKIADGAVTASHISSAGVTPGLSLVAAADGAVGWEQIGSVGIANGAITTDKIADNAITTAKIADKAVTAEKLADGVFTTDKIADSAVITEKLADNAVVTAKIADKNVTTDKIADKAVTAEKLADGVLDGFVTVAQGEANANKAMVIDAVGNVFAGQVVADAIADNAVVTAKIADKAVTAEKLADGILSAKVDIAQGEANANKVMVTDASGNVVTTDVLSSDVLPDATVSTAGVVTKLPNVSMEELEGMVEAGTLSEEEAMVAVPSFLHVVEFVDESNSYLNDSISEIRNSTSEIRNSAVVKPSNAEFGAVPQVGYGGQSVVWAKVGSSGIADRAVSVDKMSSRHVVGSWNTYTGIAYNYGNATSGLTLVANGSGEVYWGQVTTSGISSVGVTGGLTLVSNGGGRTYWGQVQTAGIADGAITAGKIADGAVTPAQTAGVVGAIPWGSADSTTYGQFWIE